MHASLNPYFIKSNKEKLLQIKIHSQDFIINADTHARVSGDKLISQREINTNENSVKLIRIYVSYSSMTCSILHIHNRRMANEKLISFIRCQFVLLLRGSSLTCDIIYIWQTSSVFDFKKTTFSCR